jgi:carbonic anhydrase
MAGELLNLACTPSSSHSVKTLLLSSKATTFKGELSSKNSACVDAVAQKNVKLAMTDIRKKSPVLAELESEGVIKIAGAMYNLETATLNFFA